MNEKKEKMSLAQTLSIAGKALKVSFKVKSMPSVVVDILGFGMALLPMLIASELKVFTNEMQAYYGEGTQHAAQVLETLGLLAAFFICQAVYNYAKGCCTQLDIARTIKFIKKTIIETSCSVKYKYIENHDNFVEKIMFADSYGGYKVSASMQTTVVLLQNFVTFVSLTVAMLRVSPLIVAIILITCIPAVVLSIIQKDSEYIHQTKWMLEGATIIHFLFMAVGEYKNKLTINEVRFYNVYKYVKRIWKNMWKIYIKKKNAITGKHVLLNSIADILRSVVYIGILLIAAKSVYKNPALGLGTFMFLFTISGQLQAIVSKLFVGAARFLGDTVYMRDFFDLAKLEREETNFSAKPFDTAEIKFTDVDFSYPNTSKKVLKNINVTIRQGEKIAIVGENGSGKSTFVSLLCGMHEPDNGVVSIDGKDIQKNLTAARRTISAVFQDFGKYETTIRENITISNKCRCSTDEELFDLLRQTNSIDVVEQQPNKLDEKIGMYSEHGNDLSGGQWQKIAMTRAAFHKDAAIMVLDEPTAALDPLAEAQLYRDFSRLTGDKTTLLISHRLGITSIVDRILVFDNGEIVEDGNHDELMERNGKYARMYRAQAQWYQEKINI